MIRLLINKNQGDSAQHDISLIEKVVDGVVCILLEDMIEALQW